MKKLSRQQLDQKITDLEKRNNEIVVDFESFKMEQENLVNQLEKDHEVSIGKIKEEETEKNYELENQIEVLKEEVIEKQKQLDRKEAKKLAQAYEDQENIYQEESKKWLSWLVWVGIGLAVSTLVSVSLSSDEKWYDKFEYFLIDIIFLSATWFCGSQYSDKVKLKTDYANRKTIAQTFNNILNNLSEDEAIKSKFIEKAVDVLCAPSLVSEKEPVLSKKLIKDTAEIVSSIKT